MAQNTPGPPFARQQGHGDLFDLPGDTLARRAPLQEAMRGDEFIPVFVVDPYFFSPERAQELPHRMQFLLESLQSLAANLEHKGSRLICVQGKSIDVIPELARKLKVDKVVAHRWVEPFGRKRDEIISEALEVPFELFEGEMLQPPGTLRTGKNTPFGVFTLCEKIPQYL